MKRSTIIVLIGLAAASATLASADFKLKRDYEQKNIKEYLSYTRLPAFHHIKDDYNPKQPWEWYICDVKPGAFYGVGIRFKAGQLLAFNVKNDTLFITKPENAAINDIAYGLPITINCDQLRSVTSTVANINLTACSADSLAVFAMKKSNVRLNRLKANYLKVSADNTSNITLSETDSLREAAVWLKGTSCFTVNNAIIGKRGMNIGDSAALRLSGRSLDNFNIPRH